MENSICFITRLKNMFLVKKDARTFFLFAIFAILAILVVILYTGFSYLPLQSLMINNADGLYIEDIARSLNHGASILDWRLTQAPYLFPDIFIARILVYLGVGIGDVSIYYHVLYGALLLTIWFSIQKKMDVDRLSLFLFVCLLYLFSYIGDLHGDLISKYFGLLGFHSGVALCVLLSARLLFFVMNVEKLSFGTVALLFVLLGCGVASDTLFFIGLVIPGIIYLTILRIKKQISWNRYFMMIGIFLGGTIAGKIFNAIHPFPQDKEFLMYFIKKFPFLAIGSAKIFLTGILQSARSFGGMFCMLLLGAFSWVLCVSYIWKKLKLGVRTDDILFLMAIISSLGFSLLLITQILFGLYVTIDSSRQWAALLFILIATGFAVFSHICLSRKVFFTSMVCGLAFVCLLSTTNELSNLKGKIISGNFFEKIIACMNKNLPPETQLAADYWLARPIRMYSKERYEIGPLTLGVGYFTNAANVKKLHTIIPKYIITGISIHEEDALKIYGEPERRLCQSTEAFGEVQILDYSHNKHFLEDMKRTAALAY